MNIASFRVESADYSIDFDDLRAIRQAVFIDEQNIPQDIEFDGADSFCHHFLARTDDHSAIGTVRLNPDGHIERMAVLPKYRKLGVGNALLITVLAKAGKLGLTEVQLNSQAPVIGFYEKFGFSTYGC